MNLKWYIEIATYIFYKDYIRFFKFKIGYIECCIVHFVNVILPDGVDI